MILSPLVFEDSKLLLLFSTYFFWLFARFDCPYMAGRAFPFLDGLRNDPTGLAGYMAVPTNVFGVGFHSHVSLF